MDKRGKNVGKWQQLLGTLLACTRVSCRLPGAVPERCWRDPSGMESAAESVQHKSHEPEFDHLKSIELDEKINAIEFVNNNSGVLKMLTTNDRIIKLWKFQYKVQKESSRTGLIDGRKELPRSQIVD